MSLPALQHLQSHVGEILRQLVALRIARGAAASPPAVAVGCVVGRGASGGASPSTQTDATTLRHRLLQLQKDIIIIVN